MRERAERNERTLITTLTKKMSEDYKDFMNGENAKKEARQEMLASLPEETPWPH